MNGIFLIDGINAYDNYGMIVALGGYRDLACYAATKDVNYSNYKEINGITADLTEVYLKNKSVKINFAILGDVEKYNSFIKKISDKSYHIFDFLDLGITEKLRYVSESKIEYCNTFTNVTVEFSDDFPVKYSTSTQPEEDAEEPIEEDGEEPTSNTPEFQMAEALELPISPNIVPAGNIEINGVNLSDYGIRVIGNNIDSILQNPKGKQHLLQTNSKMDSVVYTDNDVTLEGKEIKLNLLMRANNIAQFWNNYRAFQRAIATAGEKTMYLVDKDNYYYFLFKSCSVKEFTFEPKIWFEFSLNVLVLAYILDDDYLLITEDTDDYITTEDELDFIEVNYI